MSFGSAGFGGFGSNNNNNNQQSSPFGGGGGAGFGANNANTNNTNTGFGGFGANNTANAPGSLFGGNTNTASSQGSGFGSLTSGGFGSNNQTSAFGQARPSAFGSSTPATSMFGSTPSTTAGTGFGGFGGAATNNNQTTSSPFGGAATNTSGGIFGQNNQASGTGFGAASTSSPFGAGTANTNTGFGSGGAFGSSTSTPAFGGAASTQQNNGTAGAPFQPFVDKDGVGGQQQQYMSIACQEPYRNFSYEELRVQDYLQGRRHGNANGQGGAFGTSTGFGGFGGNNATNTSSPFGASNNNNTTAPFGQQSSAPAFGSTAANTTGGFGSTAGSSLFGQNKPATGGLFGGASTTPQQSGGLFGNNNASSTTPNAFGANNNNNTTGGLFGAAKPATGFGAATNTGGFGSNTTANATGSNLFGAANNNNTSTSSLFGGNNNNQQQQQQPANNAFGGGGLFGNNAANTAQQPAQNTSGGLFGGSTFGANNNQAKPGGLFGSGTTANAGSSLFGNNNANAQPQANTGSSLFGSSLNNNQQNQTGGGGLFGAPKPAAPSLFGSTVNNQPSGGLFGNAPNNTGGSLFGNAQQQNNNTGGGGLFGSANNNNNNQQKPGGLFGGSFGQTNTTATGGNSLFGSSQQNNANQSLLGNSFMTSQQPQQQQSVQGLTASISSGTPYGNTELFASLATPQQSVGPLATPLSSSQKQRKPAPLAQWKINPAASSRLITPQKRTGGYGFSYSTYGTPGSAYGSPSLYGGLLGGSTSSRLGKSLSTSNLRTSYGGPGSTTETVLNADAFSPTPRSYRTGGSLKKLHINRNLRSDLFGPEDSSQKPSPLKKAVSFNADQSPDANGAQSSSALVQTEGRDSATPSAEDLGFIRSPAKPTNGVATTTEKPQPEVEQVQGNELAVVHEDEPETGRPAGEQQQQQRPLSMFPDQTDKTPGEYWTKPSKAEIAKMTRQQRKSVKGFTVGREHTGFIEFSEVNLDGVDLDAVIGKDIRIVLREANVYTDSINKPAPGKGFNVPSTVTLYNAWPRARGGQIPVFEKRGKRFDKHIERLSKVKDTEFVNYDPTDGSWTFRVQHFSSYQVPDYYDDDDMADLNSSMFSAPPDTPTPAAAHHDSQPRFPHNQPLSNGMSTLEDPFAPEQSSRLPGAFDDDVFLSDRREARGFNDSNLITGEFTTDVPAADAVFSRPFDSSQTSSARDVDASTSHMDGTMEIDGPKHSPNFNASVRPKSILKASQQLPYLGGTPTHAVDAGTGDWADQLQRTVSPKKQDRNALLASNLDRSRQTRATNGTENPTTFSTSIDIFKSLFGGDSGKSTKQAAEGKGFQWPYPKQSKIDQDTPTVLEDELQKIFKPSWASEQPLSKSSERESTTLQLMNNQRQLAKFTVVDNVSQAEMKTDFSFETFADAVETQAKRTTSATQIKLLGEERTMWNLAHLLFDPVGTDDEQRDAEIRKDQISDFWAALVKDDAREQADNAGLPEDKALAYLSGRDSAAAAEALVQGRDFRLAMSVAQLGTDEEMRSGMAQQIEHWRDNNTLSEMSARIRVLYELLAGNTTVSEGKIGAGPENRAADIFIGQECGLDWRRCFGLKLWYGSAVSEKLAETVIHHHQDLEQGEEKVAPRPRFAQAGEQQGVNDILWSLLKIYAMSEAGNTNRVFYDHVWDTFDTMIAARTLTGDATSARLTFQLYQALAVRGVADYDNEVRTAKADQHAVDFASELAASPDSLVDAVFVTLHITDTELREKAVKALLRKHAGAIGGDAASSQVYQTLSQDFLLPEAWLWAAKAAYAKTVQHDDVAEMRCLLRAGQPREAHATLRQRVGPRAVIEEDTAALRAVLADFEAFGLAKSADWPRGGGLYADYLALLGLARAAETTRPERRRLAQRLLAALPRVDGAGLALEERAAVAEMASVAARLLKEAQGHDAKQQQQQQQQQHGKHKRTPSSAPAAAQAHSHTVGADDGVPLETLRLAVRYHARALAV